MELWDIYDVDRNKKNKTITRGEKLKKGDYHLVVHICIFNSNGEMLIQQRQPFKDIWFNMWDITAGGSAIEGETSQTAMERELFEEIGLKLDLKDIRPHITINFEEGFDDIYLIEKDIDIKELTLQYAEVQEVKWASKDEILSLIDKGDFIPYFQNFITLLFDMRKQYGSICEK